MFRTSVARAQKKTSTSHVLTALSPHGTRPIAHQSYMEDALLYNQASTEAKQSKQRQQMKLQAQEKEYAEYYREYIESLRKDRETDTSPQSLLEKKRYVLSKTAAAAEVFSKSTPAPRVSTVKEIHDRPQITQAFALRR